MSAELALDTLVRNRHEILGECADASTALALACTSSRLRRAVNAMNGDFWTECWRDWIADDVLYDAFWYGLAHSFRARATRLAAVFRRARIRVLVLNGVVAVTRSFEHVLRYGSRRERRALTDIEMSKGHQATVACSYGDFEARVLFGMLSLVDVAPQKRVLAISLPLSLSIVRLMIDTDRVLRSNTKTTPSNMRQICDYLQDVAGRPSALAWNCEYY